MTDDELRFIEYWEKNRVRQGRWQYQLISGLPWGLLMFGVPIILNLLVGRSWYKNLPYISAGDVDFILLAAMIIILFYSVFRKRFLWERQEQQYQELKVKQQKEKGI